MESTPKLSCIGIGLPPSYPVVGLSWSFPWCFDAKVFGGGS